MMTKESLLEDFKEAGAETVQAAMDTLCDGEVLAQLAPNDLSESEYQEITEDLYADLEGLLPKIEIVSGAGGSEIREIYHGRSLESLKTLAVAWSLRIFIDDLPINLEDLEQSDLDGIF